MSRLHFLTRILLSVLICLTIPSFILALLTWQAVELGVRTGKSEFVFSSLRSVQLMESGYTEIKAQLWSHLEHEGKNTGMRLQNQMQPVEATENVTQALDLMRSQLRQRGMIPINRLKQLILERNPILRKEDLIVEFVALDAPLSLLSRGDFVSHTRLEHSLITLDPSESANLGGTLLKQLCALLFNMVYYPSRTQMLLPAFKVQMGFEPATSIGKIIALHIYTSAYWLYFYPVRGKFLESASLRYPVMQPLQSDPLVASGYLAISVNEAGFLRNFVETQARKAGFSLLSVPFKRDMIRVPEGIVLADLSPEEFSRRLLAAEQLQFSFWENGEKHFGLAQMDSLSREFVYLFRVSERDLAAQIESYLLSSGVPILLLILVLVAVVGFQAQRVAFPLTELTRRIAEQAMGLRLGNAPIDSRSLSDWDPIFLETGIMQKQLLVKMQDLERRFWLLEAIAKLQAAIANGIPMVEFDKQLAEVVEDCRLDERIAFDEQKRFYENRLAMDAAYRRGLAQEREFVAAKSVQESLLPAALYYGSPWTLAAHYAPARYLGGDFYDCFEMNGTHYALVADVSGKGLASALYGAMIKSVFFAEAEQGGTLSDLLSRVNQIAVERGQDGFFCTMFVVCWQEGQELVRYVSAGHNRMFALGDKFVELSAKGLPLGIFADMRYEEKTLELKSGTALVLYTDGVVEAEDPAANLYGMDAFRNLLNDSHLLKTAEPVQVVQTVVQELSQHMQSAPAADDITILIMRYNKELS